MPRQPEIPLTPARIVAITAPGRYGGGGGLYLQVSPGGGRSWLFRYRFAGREHWIGLGPVDIGNLAAGLAEARQKAAEARSLLSEGKDPLAVKRAQAASTAPAKAPSFRDLAGEFLAAHEGDWKNPVHRRQWRQTLTTYVYPVLGDRSVDVISTEDVHRCLEPIWRSIPETARRVRGRIETILDLAIARGLRTAANPATVRVMRALLGKGRRRVAHHAALPYADVPKLVRRLAGRRDVPALALQFLILTATRSSEARGARWDEIDQKRELWIIPPARMKGGREHAVPLSPAALGVLKAVPRGTSPYVFAGPGGDPISDTALRGLLRSLGIDRSTGTLHGFRSSFRDWAAENGIDDPVAEACLAHTVTDKVVAAYRRTRFLEARRDVMLAWGLYAG